MAVLAQLHAQARERPCPHLAASEDVAGRQLAGAIAPSRLDAHLGRAAIHIRATTVTPPGFPGGSSPTLDVGILQWFRMA